MKKKSLKTYRIYSKILTVIVIISLIYGAANAFRVYNLMRDRTSVLKENGAKITAMEEEIKFLENEIEQSDSFEFVEKVARDDLGMVKPREIIVIDKNKKSTEITPKINEK